MKSLSTATNFGGTDADNDDILLQAFEDHEAFSDVMALRKHMIIGKKGSGKTAIFKKIVTTKEPEFFSFGHTFSDYPWHHHQAQARIGIPDFDKYTHSWKYLILLSGAKIVLNQDQSLPFDRDSLDDMQRIEAFVVDTYGSRDPDLSQIFVPTKRLKLKPYFEFDYRLLRAGVSPESVPVTDLPTIVQDVNAALMKSLLRCLHPEHRYFIAFDQLDLGFDLRSEEYANRLIGLLLASRDINIAAREAGKALFIVVFLRDDIYDCLHFEDKNKMTENFVSIIEWDTPRTSKTLKGLMERRFSIVLGENPTEAIRWDMVFNEGREMPGHQTKYEHILDRTYLRPRDIIKFTNCALSKYKERLVNPQTGQDRVDTIDNSDIHNARIEYSDYFMSEVDDEVHRHIPEYDRYLDVIKLIGKWHFDRPEFEAVYASHYEDARVGPLEALEQLYDFSFIGFYRAGGRGYGGSEYVFKYTEGKMRFDPTASRFRVHPGLIEGLGLKRI